MMAVKRVMNPKRLDTEGKYLITGEFYITENLGIDTEKSFVAIQEKDEVVRIDVKETLSGCKRVVSYTINNVRTNAYKQRNIKKFFFTIKNELGKDYMKEHRDDLRILIGEINSKIYEEVSKRSEKGWVMNLEVAVCINEDNKPELAYIEIEFYKPVKIYKLVPVES